MKIPYFCCIGAELKRYQKDFDFMNQVYLYKIPVEDTVEEVFSQDYFKAIADTVLQDDIVYIYEATAEKMHTCRFNLSLGHITAVRLISDIEETIKDNFSILHSVETLSNIVDTTTVIMLDELQAFENLDSRPSYKAPGAMVVDNAGNRGIIESIDQENETAVIVTTFSAVKSINGQTGDVVLTGEDISADVSEQTDTVQGHLQTLHDNIKDIELFKFPNATIIGEPTINHGQISGFTVNDYLQFPFILDLHNKPFVIDFCFTTGNDVTTQQNILDSQFGLALAIANGRGLMAISHNGTSWAGSITGTLPIQPNTTYYARLSWNRMNYQTQLSTDGTTYTPDMNFGSTQSPYPRTMFIGGSSSSDIGHTPHPFGGSINMNYAYLTVEGNVIWQGMDDAGLATRMTTDVSNITEAGKERIKQIVDIDSKQNKLVAGKNITIDESTNEISATGGSGRNIGDIFYTKRTDTALAGAVECNGGTYSTADYTDAGSIGELLAGGKLDYISLSDYATAISTKGWCDKIGWDGGTTVRVPTLTPHIIQKNNIPVLGNGISIGYTDGTNLLGEVNWNSTQKNGTEFTTGAYNKSVGTNITGASAATSKAIGLTTDGTKSGIIADTTDTAQLRVMFQLFNSTTDAAVATVGTVVAQVGELNSHRVIDFQIPTAGNGYTWYRKYADGWVEQGGVAVATSDAPYVRTLLVEMKDSNYVVTITRDIGATETTFNNINSRWQVVFGKTKTSFGTWGVYGSKGTIMWQVSGMAE